MATGNSFSGTKFDFGDAVLKLTPAPSLGLVDWFAPTNWAQLNTQDLDLGSTEPVILSSSYLFQIGKEGVGYVLNANNLGHIGGQVYSAQVCDSDHGAYGGLAHSSPYLIVPCDDGLVALNVNPGSNPPFTIAWRGPNFLTGPPIIAGNAVWDVDVSDGRIYTLSLTTGTTLFTDTIGSLPTHFNSLSAGDGQVFVTANRQLRAYIPQVAVTFHTTPTTFYGTTTPGKITACGATLTDGQSANCADNFTATSALPSPSTNWEFDYWQWSGGVTCTNANINPTSCTATSAGSLTAVYATLVKFESTGINWATCGNATEPLDGTVFSPAGTVSACYVPTGFSIAYWSCSDGLACSGSSNVIPVSITGPGTITLNLQMGTLSNPVSTNITALTSTPNPSPGARLTSQVD